jgi:hypothetical protein
MKKYSSESLSKFMDLVLDLDFFRKDPNYDNTPCIQVQLDKMSSEESKLIVITGDNASGKSVIRRILHEAMRKAGLSVMQLSQQSRTDSGIQRAMIYGAEEWDSTGYISTKSVNCSFRSSHAWAKDNKNKHGIIWDEPDIGLSDAYAAGLGVKIAEFIKTAPDKLFAAFIITHNRELVKQLVASNPWHLRVGGCLPLHEWLVAPVVARNPDELHEEGLARFRRISKVYKV